MAQAKIDYPPLEARPMKNTICLFDVDNTLGPARQPVSPEMHALLSRLRCICAIGYVSGSNLDKQQEQLSTPDVNVTSRFDFCFSENGLVAYKMGVQLSSTSFINKIGETDYKKLVNWVLKYVADLDIPVKRGTFVEFRNGMVNISPIGRNASNEERDEFQKYDKEKGIRKTMVEALKGQFPNLGLTYSIGGQISFDVFPDGWDKTYCLRHLEAKEENGLVYKDIHFFGDMTEEGGNDYELYKHPKTIGHAVKDPSHTMVELEKLLKNWETEVRSKAERTGINEIERA